jgi:predicted regulator of Ras-like GTPase activity (Roadblock/LC7/MglB family)
MSKDGGMPGLREVVQHLIKRDGVDAVLVVSADGLIIDHAASPGVDTDAIAALLPALTQSARQVGEVTAGGRLTHAAFEFGNRQLVLSALGDDIYLAILTSPDVNIGNLLYDLRRHQPALASLI